MRRQSILLLIVLLAGFWPVAAMAQAVFGAPVSREAPAEEDEEKAKEEDAQKAAADSKPEEAPAVTEAVPAPQPEQPAPMSPKPAPVPKQAEAPVDPAVEMEHQVTRVSQRHATNITAACFADWEDYGCLREASDAFLTGAAVYADALESKGKGKEIGHIKEHCSASTAATRLENIPTYAVRSAFVECVNEIYDISERTKIKPDLELYQMMVMAVLCLDKDPRCKFMETALKQGKN